VTTTPAAVTVVDLSGASSDSHEVAAATHIGPVRKENQDAYAATPLRGGDGVAVVVADGMGGLPGGREAAAAATTAAVDVLAEGEATLGTVLDAVHAANRAVDAVRSEIGGQPGTTLTLAAVRGHIVWIGHAGDSRAYLVRGGTATVLTRDHSWVGDQVRAGALEAGSERHHARRNIITMAVMGDDIEPQALSLELSRGDIVMLCSDGFWEPLTDDQIAELLATPGPLTAVVERAAQAALDAGAADNVSLIALRFGD
jgi:PPM family protein phosphatase